jgi:hypothetical protein
VRRSAIRAVTKTGVPLFNNSVVICFKVSSNLVPIMPLLNKTPLLLTRSSFFSFSWYIVTLAVCYGGLYHVPKLVPLDSSYVD